MIPVEESFAAWRKDPEYEEAYNALEEEFALAAAMIEARARAGHTQQQLADPATEVNSRAALLGISICRSGLRRAGDRIAPCNSSPP
jgi:hypothetical protein